MIPPRLASFPHASAHGAALAARTGQAVAHNADVRNPVGVVERVNAYGAQADVVVLHESETTPPERLAESRYALVLIGPEEWPGHLGGAA